MNSIDEIFAELSESIYLHDAWLTHQREQEAISAAKDKQLAHRKFEVQQKRWRTTDLKRSYSHARKWDHLTENQHCYRRVDAKGNYRWYSRETHKLHRVDESGHQDGPAMYSQDMTQIWYREGKQHRENGPACTWYNGVRHYYLDGVLQTELQVIAQFCNTPEDAEEFLKYL